MCPILLQARLVIAWSQKLQERVLPGVQMLFSLHLHCVCCCSSDQRKPLGQAQHPCGRDTGRGRICDHFFADVLVMPSGICPRICHFSLVSPPPPLGPKVSSSVVWLLLSPLLWSRVAFANYKPHMLLFPLKPLVSSPLFGG